LIDALAEHRGLVAAAQHVLQRQRTLQHGLGMPGEQVEKPLLSRQKGTKPAQHRSKSIVLERTVGRPVTKLS